MQPEGFIFLTFLLIPSLLLPFINNCLLAGFSANPSPDCNIVLISIVLVILNVIFYFIIGTIVGLILGKTKSKK